MQALIDTLKAWGEGHQERLSCGPLSKTIAKTVSKTIKAPNRAA